MLKLCTPAGAAPAAAVNGWMEMKIRGHALAHAIGCSLQEDMS
jgi:hypothetical protein